MLQQLSSLSPQDRDNNLEDSILHLEKALQNDRRYIIRYGCEYPIQAVSHPIATDTCYEKSRLLKETHSEDWDPRRIVKAIYGRVNWEMYGFVFPELDQTLQLAVVQNIFSELGLEPPYSRNDIHFEQDSIPAGMDKGTCTPFASAEEMKYLSGIIIHDMPSLDDQLVDISIGGKGEEAHKLSLHLPYKAIFSILRAEYGSKISKVNFFK